MRRNRLGIHSGHDDDSITDFSGIATVSSDNSHDSRTDTLGMLESEHEVRTNILFQIATADGHYEDRVIRVEAADLEPLGKNSLPTLVVSTRSQLRDIVGRRISLDSDDLA